MVNAPDLMNNLTSNSEIIPTPAGRPTLDSVLGHRSHDTVYPCIRDLIENGLDPARFSAGEHIPHHQDLTQYLAAWSRLTGLSEEESRSWLTDYCIVTLGPNSRKTPAAIRHRTKSNLRYIYRSAVPFLCRCESNHFRARCGVECPVYAEMQEKLRVKALAALNPIPMRPAPEPIVTEPYIPLKKLNSEQFKTGMSLALDEFGKGTKPLRIVEILNERGLKTRTGRTWTIANFRKELEGLKTSQNAHPASDASA